jgi:hypothetical protein
MRTESSDFVRSGRLLIPGADDSGLKRTQWETLHCLAGHEVTWPTFDTDSKKSR